MHYSKSVRGSNYARLVTIVKTIVSFLLSAACLSGLAFAQQDVTLTVTVSAHERTAHVRLPPNMDRSKKYPLVIGYPGAGETR